MGTYFTTVQDALNEAVPGQVGGTTTTGNASATPAAVTPYAAPSTFTNVPLNQLGPYNDSDAWGGLDPTANITVGPGPQSPYKGAGMYGQIAQHLQTLGYGKPSGNLEDWVIGQIKKHYRDQGGHLVQIPTKDGGKVGVKALGATPTDKPGKKDLTPSGDSGIGKMIDSIDSGTGHDVMAAADAIGGLFTKGFSSGSTTVGNGGPKVGSSATDNALVPKQNAAEAKVDALFNYLGIPKVSGIDPWVQIAQAMGVPTSQTGAPVQKQGGQLATTISLLPRDQLIQLQNQLWNAGFYDSRSWTPGVIDLATKQAWGAALNQTANLNKLAGTTANGNTYSSSLKYATVWDVLTAEANNVTQQGGIDTLNAETASKKYTAATESQMDQPTLTAFEERLGRAPTAAELAGVTNQMDAQQQAKAEGMPDNSYIVPGEGGVASVPGVTTPTALAAQYAMTQDPTEYEGHSLANAYGLMINALSGKPVGSDPNITNVSRPL